MAEMNERAEHMATLKNRGLSHCAAAMPKSGLLQRMQERLEKMAQMLREERGLGDSMYTWSLLRDSVDCDSGLNQRTTFERGTW